MSKKQLTEEEKKEIEEQFNRMMGSEATMAKRTGK